MLYVLQISEALFVNCLGFVEQIVLVVGVGGQSLVLGGESGTRDRLCYCSGNYLMLGLGPLSDPCDDWSEPWRQVHLCEIEGIRYLLDLICLLKLFGRNRWIPLDHVACLKPVLLDLGRWGVAVVTGISKNLELANCMFS